jgi:hypothetical protein
MQIRSHAQKWFIQMQKKGKGAMIPPKCGDPRSRMSTVREGSANDTQSQRVSQHIGTNMVCIHLQHAIETNRLLLDSGFSGRHPARRSSPHFHGSVTKQAYPGIFIIGSLDM